MYITVPFKSEIKKKKEIEMILVPLTHFLNKKKKGLQENKYHI